MARNKNNIWFKVFNDIIGYMLTEKYPYNDTLIEAIKLVDEIADININIPGNYVVREDNTVYDQDKVLVYALLDKDKIKIDGIEYFVAESDHKIHEITTIWNNTLIGDHGIDLEVGVPSDDHTFNMPAIVFYMSKEQDINMLESEGTDGLKNFLFNIGIVARELDLYERTQAYAETERIEDITSGLIYDYFQSAYCKLDSERTNRMTEWSYESEIISEDERPLIISKMINTVYYR